VLEERLDVSQTVSLSHMFKQCISLLSDNFSVWSQKIVIMLFVKQMVLRCFSFQVRPIVCFCE
jgi:hypothetical protein